MLHHTYLLTVSNFTLFWFESYCFLFFPHSNPLNSLFPSPKLDPHQKFLCKNADQPKSGADRAQKTPQWFIRVPSLHNPLNSRLSTKLCNRVVLDQCQREWNYFQVCENAYLSTTPSLLIAAVWKGKKEVFGRKRGDVEEFSDVWHGVEW